MAENEEPVVLTQHFVIVNFCIEHFPATGSEKPLLETALFIFNFIRIWFLKQLCCLRNVMCGYTVHLRQHPHLVVLSDELKGLHAESKLSAVLSWVDPNCGINFATGNVQSRKKWFTPFWHHPPTICHCFSCIQSGRSYHNSNLDQFIIENLSSTHACKQFGTECWCLWTVTWPEKPLGHKLHS